MRFGFVFFLIGGGIEACFFTFFSGVVFFFRIYSVGLEIFNFVAK